VLKIHNQPILICWQHLCDDKNSMSVTTTPHPDDVDWTDYVSHLAGPTEVLHISGDGTAFSCDVDVLGDNVTASDMVASEEAPIADEMAALVIWIWNRFIGPVDNKHSTVISTICKATSTLLNPLSSSF
jgi:hypothetical protein